MKVMPFVWRLYFWTLPVIRQRLRILLKGGAGHTSSMFNTMIAKRDARGKCRIDKCAQVLCEYLTAAGLTGIEGKRCLEIGTGTVGSTPVVMWLLGAHTVTSVDLNRLLVVDALKESIIPVEKTELLNILQKHVKSEESLNGRVNQIFAWAMSKEDTLPDYFTYRAPFDILKCKREEEFDFVFSASTLEHIPRSLVEEFLVKMVYISANGAVGLHSIDLKDHYDSEADPLGFLAIQGDNYSDDSEADSRGNRIRGSEWLEMFGRSGLTAEIVLTSSAPHSCLPAILASPFSTMDVQELLLTSVLVRTYKYTQGA